MIRTERTDILLHASFEILHLVLTDYERYQEWMPGVTRSRILVREGDIAVVELEVRRFAVRPVTFELVRATPYRIQFSQVGQLGARGLAGALTLTAGTEGVGTVNLEIESSLRIPFYRLVPRRIMRQALGEYTHALVTRLQALARPQTASGKRRMILEVRKREDTLEVWYRGTLFTSPLDQGDTGS